MAILDESKRLKKELSLFSVYAIATGTTLSAGFFLLPGLAAREAGPAVVLSYIIAAAFLVPAMLSIVELATAMPRAGGAYYFLDRSLGPVAGTVGGLGRVLGHRAIICSRHGRHPRPGRLSTAGLRPVRRGPRIARSGRGLGAVA